MMAPRESTQLLMSCFFVLKNRHFSMKAARNSVTVLHSKEILLPTDNSQRLN